MELTHFASIAVTYSPEGGVVSPTEIALHRVTPYWKEMSQGVKETEKLVGTEINEATHTELRSRCVLIGEETRQELSNLVKRPVCTA